MKKNFLKSVFALMCACVMTTGFVACGSDDDGNNNGNQPQEEVEPGKLLSATGEFVITTTAFDALKAIAADGKVMVRYTYDNGVVKTEEMTSSTFQRAVDYSFNDEGKIIASMQVYLNDINEEKLRELIGTQPIRAKISRIIVLKHENTNEKNVKEFVDGYVQFERTEDKVNAAVKLIKKGKEKDGLISITAISYTIGREGGSVSTETWLDK